MRYITLAIAILIGISAEGQIIRAEPFYTAAEAVSGNLLLDDYPGAAVAYSLRKLDKDYTGSAIRVRRSSDNTEQNIGFVNNYLDTAAMKTFVGNNNGFVVTWYNQADSAGVFGIRNATQGTAANQPRIINSGSIEYQNNEVAIRYNGTSQGLLASSIAGAFSSFATIFSLSGPSDTNTDDDNTFDFNNPSTYQLIQINKTLTDSVQAYSRQRTVSQFYNSWGNQMLYYQFLNATSSLAIAINGNNPTSITYTAGITSSSGAHGIGANRALAGNFMTGTIQEMIFYSSDKSSDRTGIRDNINSFYSVY